jgi:diadenosine tetraphosphate (Ap4A) HIT family hydrolase
MNNSLLPWFIIVPVTQQKEIFELEAAEQKTLYKNINMLSRHLLQHYEVTKINIGAIGNIVSQLHVHVIGRRETDYAWPNVVWGNPQKKPYREAQLQRVVDHLVLDNNIKRFDKC